MEDEQPVALVTGSTSGIGRAVARRLSADGFRVIGHSRTSPGDDPHLHADLADEDATRALGRRAVAAYGRLDVLVNNAGLSRPVPHDDLAAADPDEWRATYAVNVIAPWLLVTETLEALRRSARPGGGCVVNVTSHAGVRPKGASIPYAASKAALNHATRLLAATLGPDVRVNAVAPGLVDTPLTAGWTDAQEHWRERAPMRRAATPDDVADLVAAVVSSAYLTGEVILLDGGAHLL